MDCQCSDRVPTPHEACELITEIRLCVINVFSCRYVQHPRYKNSWDEMWRKMKGAASRTRSVKSKARCHSVLITYKTFTTWEKHIHVNQMEPKCELPTRFQIVQAGGATLTICRLTELPLRWSRCHVNYLFLVVTIMVIWTSIWQKQCELVPPFFKFLTYDLISDLLAVWHFR